MSYALINRIIDSSVVDGPGNRTSIFFQGCNFNCQYCHNPETINKCKNCGTCIPGCPTGAIYMDSGNVFYNASKCCQCDQCIKACPYSASPKVTVMSPEEVAARVESNLPFIRGVTCSGGECSLNASFITELFTLLKSKGLNCLLDSNGGAVDFSQTPELMSVVDGVMLDIKEMDPKSHEELTGQGNELVLKNAVYLASIGKLPEIRTVVNSHMENTEELIQSIGELLSPFMNRGSICYRLIQFRPFGVREMYRSLGTPSLEQMLKLKETALSIGFSKVIIT